MLSFRMVIVDTRVISAYRFRRPNRQREVRPLRGRTTSAICAGLGPEGFDWAESLNSPIIHFYTDPP